MYERKDAYYRKEPVDWFATTEEEVIRHTEEQGYYVPGTVLDMLKGGEIVRTPWAQYRYIR